MTLGTCDWGCCPELAIGWRYDPDTRLMLPVCDSHRADYILAA